jgi:Cu+-exporting ATPase
MDAAVKNTVKCYHCGENCDEFNFREAEKRFCCGGCKLVYELLNQNGLCEYYDITSNPGITQKIKIRAEKFNFLDDREIWNKLVHFTDNRQSHVTWYLPQMHCSSCIWLLENLPKLDKGVISSRVNFPKKELTVIFSESSFSLRKTAELITSIGYEPHISLNDMGDKKIKKQDRSRILKLGIAGFCFGNIMMLSFPEYFSGGNHLDKNLKTFFLYLNILLSLPVFFYSASEFYMSAWLSLKQKFLNIDAPIVLAIVITFARSIYEITSGTGSGYLDSMSGIVFFMLAGRVFQDRIFQSISFERDYKSYFPISVTIIKDGKEVNLPLDKLKAGDRILVRNLELIPADSILFSGKANIDYSFVTGESVPQEKTIGEIIYAGGKQQGPVLELEVIKEVSQSYLTQLWNREAFKQTGEKGISFIHRLSRQFTWIILSIAAIAAAYWSVFDSVRIMSAVSAVLIIACPCALLLSATFTNGNIIRILGDNQFYLKNSGVIEALARADTIVFDKTGTITQNGKSRVAWIGAPLSNEQRDAVYALARQSSHPFSIAISDLLHQGRQLKVQQFREYPGQGLEGIVLEQPIRMGSFRFITGSGEMNPAGGKVYIKTGEELPGHFTIQNEYRKDFSEMIQKLKTNYSLALLSGDNEGEKNQMIKLFERENSLLFNQSPEDKLSYIDSLQKNHHRVIMLGDGLNDSGALKKSDIGIAVSDNINNFSPACDAILSGSVFHKLPAFINYAKAGRKIILGSFLISVIYNIIGISFAVRGTLSPVIAAILMPASSITIVAFTTGLSSLVARKYRL